MSSLPPIPLQRIIRAAESQSWLDAYAVLGAARAEALNIVEMAEATVAAARQQGYEDGLSEGVAEAARLTEAARAEAANYIAGIEDELTDLVVFIAGRILDGFDDRALVAAAVGPALSAFGDERQVSVAVAPEMVPCVEAILSRAEPVRQIEVIPDRHLTARQCIVSSPWISVDASVDAQLARIRETITFAVTESRA